MPEKRYALMEVKEIQEDGTFEGLLASYNNVDMGGDRILPGAFTKTMQERNNQVPLLWQHDQHSPIGKLTLSDSPEGLRVKGKFSLDVPLARDAYYLIKDGVIQGLSIGYDAVKKSFDNGVRQLSEIRLWEGSVVTTPMNQACMITSLKTMNAGGSTIAEDAEMDGLSATRRVDPSLERLIEGIKGFVELSVKEGRTLSAATKKTLGAAQDHASGIALHVQGLNDCFNALFDDGAVDDDPEPGESNTLKTAAAVEVKPEPVEDHSAAAEILTGLRSLFSQA